jgi:hypothetical protein
MSLFIIIRGWRMHSELGMCPKPPLATSGAMCSRQPIHRHIGAVNITWWKRAYTKTNVYATHVAHEAEASEPWDILVGRAMRSAPAFGRIPPTPPGTDPIRQRAASGAPNKRRAHCPTMDRRRGSRRCDGDPCRTVRVRTLRVRWHRKLSNRLIPCTPQLRYRPPNSPDYTPGHPTHATTASPGVV